MMNMRTLALLTVLSLIVPAAHADWVISDGTTSLINFDSDFAGLYNVPGPSSTLGVSVAEPNSYQRGGNAYSAATMYSESVSVAVGANNPSGRGTGLPTYFGTDYNKNGETNNSAQIVQGCYVGIAPGTPVTGNAFCLANAAWESSAVYFRIRNNTGAAVDSWRLQMDLFANETGSWPTAGSIISFGYAVDSGDDPNTMSFTALGSPITITQTTDLELFAQPDLTANVSVPDGGILVLKINQDDQGGNGSVVFLDNIGITAVPEPATMGLLTLGGAALLRRRR